MNDSNEFEIAYAEQLAIEALTIGAVFVPWTYIVSGFITRVPLFSSAQSPISIFIAGAGFHIVAELTGLNEYYLTNSASHMLCVRKWNKSQSKSREKPCGITFLE